MLHLARVVPSPETESQFWDGAKLLQVSGGGT